LELGFAHLGSYDVYLWICSGVVLIYVLKGGLTSAIYTEVLQFFMIVLGFAPVVYLGLERRRRLGTTNSTLPSRKIQSRRWI
jgi:Na+/proline symporter